jgi:hypothetical protein
MIQMYSYLSGQLAQQRRREMLADAGRQRLARQARAPRRAAPQAGRPIRRALRAAARIRAHAPA